MLTKEEVVRLAREAGLGPVTISALEFRDGSLSRFAALVTEAEREACAQLAKRVASDNYEGAHIAAAIRARGEKGGV